MDASSEDERAGQVIASKLPLCYATESQPSGIALSYACSDESECVQIAACTTPNMATRATDTQ